MCASFAPPKPSKPTFAVGKGPPADSLQSNGTGRHRSLSPVGRVSKQKITLDQLSPLRSTSSNNNHHNVNNTVTPSTSRTFTTPVSPADGGGTPRVTYFPTFAEIARGAIRQEAFGTNNDHHHDPFARARARAAAEEEERVQQRERAVAEKKQRRTRRQMVVVLALLVVVVAWRWFDNASGMHPSANAASTKTALAAPNKRGAKQKIPADGPPPPPGFLSHLATDMPAIATSKAHLAAVLKLAKIKAKPGQVDLAWSALTSGEARPTETLSFWGGWCGYAALTAKVFLAGVLRSPGMAVGSFLVIVVTIGAVIGGMWWAGEGESIGGRRWPGGVYAGRDNGSGRIQDYRVRDDAGGSTKVGRSNNGSHFRCASPSPMRELRSF